MKADQARREARFIQWDVPTSKQEVLSEELTSGKTARMDKDKITVTAVGEIALRCAKALHESCDGKELSKDLSVPVEGMQPLSLWTFVGPKTQKVEVPRDALVKILSETCSDTVVFYATRDMPLLAFSSIGQTEGGDPKTCMAIIAPCVKEA